MSTFTGTINNDTQTGTSGDDIFNYGQGGSDTLSGLDGNDTFNMAGALDAGDSIDGGTGNDTVNLSGTTSVVFGATTMVNVELLNLMNVGASYNLTLNATTVTAGQSMVITAPNSAIIEHIDGSLVAGNLNIGSGTGADTLIGGSGNDWFVSRGGDDIINGNGGVNRLSFGGLSQGVTVSLVAQGGAQGTGVGNMTLSNIQDVFGTNFADTLTGDDNANTLQGNGGNDTINGGGGNDFIVIGGVTLSGGVPIVPGNAHADGGAGTDTLSFYTAPQQVTVSPGNVYALGGVDFDLSNTGTQASQYGTITQTNFENLQGTKFDDNLKGDGGNNILYGADGDDTLSGGAGNDTLYGDKLLAINVNVSLPSGGANPSIFQFPEAPTLIDATTGGDDLLRGGAGDDILDGGAGNNAALYDDATGDVTVDLNKQGVAQYVGGGDGNDTLISIQNVLGGDFNDHLTGDGNDNILVGGKGDDVLVGGAGNDTLYGGNYTGDPENPNPDTVAGHDILIGGAGNDTLIGTPVAGSTATAVFSGNAALYSITNNNGTFTVSGPDGTDTLTNIQFAQFDDQTVSLDANTYFGTSGSDAFLGNANDNLFDFSIAPGGTDVADGGAGIDTAKFAGSQYDAQDEVWLPDGVTATEGAETVTLHNIERVQFDNGTIALGTGGNDVMGPTAGVVGFGTGDGNDTITPGAGTFEIFAGNGGDTVVLSGNRADWNISAVAGENPGFLLTTTGSAITIHDVEAVQFDDVKVLLGTPGDDFRGGDANNNLFDFSIAPGGHDTANGQGGIDTAKFAGSVYDVIVNSWLVDGVDATIGTEHATLHNIERVQFDDATFVLGTSNNDVMGPAAGVTGYSGGDGDDTITPGAGTFEIFAGDGNDTVGLGGNRADWTVSAVNGDNPGLLFTKSGSAVTVHSVEAVQFDDGKVFFGTSVDDNLVGDSGDNLFDFSVAPGGTDVAYGGAGLDTAKFAGSIHSDLDTTWYPDGVTAEAFDHTYTVTLHGIERAQFDDATVVLGTSDNDVMGPTAGVTGFAGGWGDDSFTPGAGTFEIFGGDGSDTVHLYDDLSAWKAGFVSGTDPVVVLTHDASNVITLNDVEQVTFDDVTAFVGTDGNDNLTGGPGNDAFIGGLGNDAINGGNGADIAVFSGNRADYTISTPANPNQAVTISGPDGTDTLTSVEYAQFADGVVQINGFIYFGTPASETQAGTPLADQFNFGQGGDDTLSGGGGDDVFNMGPNLATGDVIDGGAGNDLVGINGDYSAPLTITGTLLSNVETLSLFAGPASSNTYNLVIDSSFAASSGFTVNAGTLGTVNTVSFDGSASSVDFTVNSGAGNDTLIGGSGNDHINGGGGDDIINIASGGNDAVSAGVGNDIINAGSALNALDSIDGGAGTDTLNLSGSTSVIFGATTLTNVENLVLADGGTYSITTDNATVAAGQTLTVNGSALGAASSLTFNGAAETDGAFILAGGAGNDVLTGGSGNDTLTAGSGNDTLNGGGGNDTFAMGAGFGAGDAIDGGAGNDTLILAGDYSVLTTITGAMLSNVETINLTAGNNYNLATDNSFVSTGAVAVNGAALGAANSLAFDGSASTVSFTVSGGAGNDTLAGGQFRNNTLIGGDGNDTFDISKSHNDTVIAGNGDDTIYAGSAWTTSDTINGGAGNDTIVVSSSDGWGIDLQGVTTFTGVENIVINGSGQFGIDEANLSAGQTLTVDASGVDSDGSLSFTFFGPYPTGGNYIITGTAGSDYLMASGGNDIINGGGGNDYIQVYGNNTINGGAGDDSILVAGPWGSGLTINGGAGYDTVTMELDFSAGVTFGANTLLNVEELDLLSGYPYILTTSDATVAAGQTLKVDGSDLQTTLTFNGAAESDGKFNIIGGSNNDVLTGGAGNDSFDISLGGNDTVNGGGGNDTIIAGGALTAQDVINGGAGSDTVTLSGPTSVVLGATTITNVENLVLADGGSYSITTNNATVGANQTLAIDASVLGAAFSLTFNGAAETDGRFIVTGGAGDDTIQGGAGNDQLNGGLGSDTIDISNGGNDTVNAGADDDTINAGAAFTALDSIDGGAGADRLILNGNYSAGVTFLPTTLVNVESIGLRAGFSYNLTTNDATVAAGQALSISADSLSSSYSLVFNGSAETNGSFFILDGHGNDSLTGGAGNDSFFITDGGIDTVNGNGGDDFILTSIGFTASDSINGGAGNDTLRIDGGAPYNFSLTVTFGASTLTNVEVLQLQHGTYNITTNDATVAAGQTLTVDASALDYYAGAPNTLTFNGAAETNGNFVVTGFVGNDYLTGGVGNDTLNGGGGNDTLDISKGGNDIVNGGDGNDTINAGAAFTAADSIDGGTGTDTLNLSGNYSTGIVFGASTLVNVEAIKLAAGFSYNLTTNDTTVAAGQNLSVDASLLTAKFALTFDGHLESDGSFAITGGAGDDKLTGGAGNDTFDITKAGNDTVIAGDGNDTINAGAAFTAADTVDGGAGNDTLTLAGVYNGLTFGATTLLNVENIVLASGFSYKLTTTDATVAATQTLTVDGTQLLSSDVLTFVGSAETNGSFTLKGGAGNDVLTGGAGNDDLQGGAGNDILTGGNGNDVLTGGAGVDTLTGGAGNDTYKYLAVSDSIGTAYDSIIGFDASVDKFFFPTAHAFDGSVTTGALAAKTFDSDLTAALAGHLLANDAILVTSSSGKFSGHTFLVVDGNGAAGYQAGQDYVIEVTGMLGTLTTANFDHP